MNLHMDSTSAERWCRYDKTHASLGRWILRSMHRDIYISSRFIGYVEFPDDRTRLDVAFNCETCDIELVLEV